MSYQWFPVDYLIAQKNTTEGVSPAKPKEASASCNSQLPIIGGVGFVTLVLLLLTILKQISLGKTVKALKFEKFKTDDLNKKLKLALETIKKMEANPDLVYAREFNLDYLRMRMDEEVFHYVIVNQIKMKIRQMVTDLRPDTKEESTVGIASSSGRKIDKIFDVTYEIESNGKLRKGVLFRVQIKLTKLPIRTSNSIVEEIIDCIGTYLSPGETQPNWHPIIEGKVVVIKWEQKAKPTPLLVLEQSEEGVTRRNEKWRSSSNKKEGNPQLS